MIQKGKLKVDDIIEKREEWVAVSLSAFQENFVTFIVCRLYGSKFYYLLQTKHFFLYKNTYIIVYKVYLYIVKIV